MSAIIHKLNGPSRDANDQYKLIVDQISNCLNEELSEHIGRMFDGADDMFFELAENADSNEDQNTYFDTMRLIRVERSNIGQIFAANLIQHLRPITPKRSQNGEFNDDELSLVDQDEMEEMVATSAMISKATNLYGDSINHLEARIEFLSMKLSGVFDKDALSPKNICQSFTDSLTDIELSTNNKLIMYKLFDQEVICQLESLYNRLNQILIDQDILPKIKIDSSRSKSLNTPEQTAPTQDTKQVFAQEDTTITGNTNYSPGQTSSASSAIADTQQQVHHVISRFISGELIASGPGIPTSFTSNKTPATGAQYYDRRDVMHALSNLQQNVAQSTHSVEQLCALDFKRALLADMGSRSGDVITKQVNQIDEKAIDFIEMLFNAIVEDNSISEPVKNLLLRLQIPVIKVAMLDTHLFENSEHPCRVTLNLIAHLGHGISSHNDELFNEINQIIEELLTDFNIDIESFTIAKNDLEGIEQKELFKTAEEEKETQKSVLQSHARDIILAELKNITASKTLVKPAQKLILKHWSTLMFHLYIKSGKCSNEWNSAVKILKQLMNILQPIKSSQAHHTLTTQKDEILGTIHMSLLGAKQNPVEIETEINNVNFFIEDMLGKSPYNSDNMNAEQTYFTAIDKSNELTESSEPEVLLNPDIDIDGDPVSTTQDDTQKFREQIASLPSSVRPGVWFKVFTGDNSPSRRVKLSVIIMDEGKLIFVDRVGVKVLEKDADTFNEELNTEHSQAISDHSAFDHALGLVINTLSGAK